MIEVYHLFDRAQHRATIGMIGFDQARRILLNQDPDYIYMKVATVVTDDLEVAFEKTNTIHQAWWLNPDVKKFFQGPGCRSTSMGDVMRTSNGDYHLVAMMGFEKISKESLM